MGEKTPLRSGALKRKKRSPEPECSQRVPPPLVLPTQTRLKITINRVNLVAVWKWKVDGDACGICREEFENCCASCKTPGDECPIAIGACKHAFHMHCIVKWTSGDKNARCPLCRQEWKFASATNDQKPLANVMDRIPG